MYARGTVTGLDLRKNISAVEARVLKDLVTWTTNDVNRVHRDTFLSYPSSFGYLCSALDYERNPPSRDPAL